MLNKKNFLDYSRDELEKVFNEFDGKKYTAKQVMQWVYKLGLFKFDKMTNISKKNREFLAENFDISIPKILKIHVSSDYTKKILLELYDKNYIELVIIPNKRRITLCISSQIGCKVNCPICATGKLKFIRNLTTGEIVSQLIIASNELSINDKITNVVFMGMGEPLYNYENVIKASTIFTDDFCFGLAKNKITISTCGVVPNIYLLANDSNVSLAVSLHASTDKLRDKIVPINKLFPLADLIKSCIYFSKKRMTPISFEYVLIDKVNNSLDDAKYLSRLIGGINCKVNLIPVNKIPNSKFSPPSDISINEFKNFLTKKNIYCIVRKTRGDEISAACGQLYYKSILK